MKINLSGRIALTATEFVLIACLFGVMHMDNTADVILVTAFGGLFLSALIWIWKDSSREKTLPVPE